MDKINELVSKMTLEEKAALCIGATAWSTTPVDRLGIPELVMTDGPHGVRKSAEFDKINAGTLPATCFPTASCTASTWDPNLLYQMGQALGEECNALDVDVLLGPGVNMKRSPLGGRNFEYFAEDPFLAGEMAASLINGIQSKGVGTSLKHYATNNQEFQRFTISSEVDERSLREIYLPAFETAVKKAQPWTVMCSYNKINGTYGSEHKYLLDEILKKEWGFEGFVVSDWGAVRNRIAALKGSLDLEMPGPQPLRMQQVIDAVKSGELDEAILNETTRRILNIVFKAQQTPKGAAFDLDAHHELARKIASEGMVLLKNNGLLPLKNPQHIAIIGRTARIPYFQGGGSSHINPTRVSVPYNEIKEQAGDAELSFCEGYPSDGSSRPELITQAAASAQAANVALIFIALPPSKESEGYDRTDLDLSPHQVALIKSVAKAQPNTIVIINNGSVLAMSEWIGDVAAVLEGWMMGQAGGGAIADILFGKVNPSGKLQETFPLRLADTPAFLNWPGENGKVRYGEGLFIGYRWYDARNIPVQFPFGFGLSYTTFAYSQPRASASTFKDVEGVTVSIDVTNTGTVAGKEVIQVYIHDQQSSLVRPYKELKGFAKVELQPGETKTVAIPLNFRSFAFYNPAHKQWITEDGDFDILVGASASDIRGSVTVTLQSTVELPCIIHRESTIREWLTDKRSAAVVKPLMDQMAAQMAELLGGSGSEEDGGIGMDAMGMILDMPLPSVLLFQQEMLPMPVDEIVDGLLAQLK